VTNDTVALSFSGGKDSTLALAKTLENTNKSIILFCMLDHNGYARSNGIHRSILNAQANSMGLSICFYPTSWQDYKFNLINALSGIKQRYSISGCVFGDIDIISHREFCQIVCNQINIQAYFPLWGQTRRQVKDQIISYKINSYISVIKNIPELQKILAKDYNTINFKDLEKNNIDICGENGEFHTLVYSAPSIKLNIKVKLKEIIDLNEHKLAVFEFS
jgi:uncharacterized protein (TIGR00290 family)